MKEVNKSLIKLIILFLVLLAISIIATLFLSYKIEFNVVNKVHAQFSDNYLLAINPIETPKKQNTNLLEYCLWDESRDDMSKIGLQGEIGALQFKQMTWDWFSKKYNFQGDINSREDQIALFNIAVAGGDGYHWTCWLKYYGVIN